MEMVSADYVLAMTAVGDSRDGYQRLLQALIEIDEEIEQRQKAVALKKLRKHLKGQEMKVCMIK